MRLDLYSVTPYAGITSNDVVAHFAVTEVSSSGRMSFVGSVASTSTVTPDVGGREIFKGPLEVQTVGTAEIATGQETFIGSANISYVSSSVDASGTAIQATSGSAVYAATRAEASGKLTGIIIVEEPIPAGGGLYPGYRESLYVRGVGGIIVNGTSRVRFVIHKAPKRGPQTLTVYGTISGEITASSKIILQVHKELTVGGVNQARVFSATRTAFHVHQVIRSVGLSFAQVVGRAPLAFSTHHVLDVVTSGGETLSGSASVDVQHPASFDVVGVNSFTLNVASGVKRYVHSELDIVGDGGLTILGQAVIIPRSVLPVVGVGGIAVGGAARIESYADRLTDEELLFLLEVA